jgi:hypothetical protein
VTPPIASGIRERIGFNIRINSLIWSNEPLERQRVWCCLSRELFVQFTSLAVVEASQLHRKSFGVLELLLASLMINRSSVIGVTPRSSIAGSTVFGG